MKKILALFAIALMVPVSGLANQTVTLVESISASSTLKGNFSEEFDYSVVNLLDGDPKTAWFEANNDFQKGEQIQLKFFYPTQIAKIGFINGYGKSDNLFAANGKIDTLVISTDSNNQTIQLKNQKQIQWFDLDQQTTTSLTLTIKSVIDGTKYKDYGFSELYIVEKAYNSKNMNPAALEKEHELMEAYMGENIQQEPNFRDLSPSDLKKLLSRNFIELGGAGPDERTWAISELIAKNKHLVSAALSHTLVDRSVFISVPDYFDGRVVLAEHIWGSDPIQIAYLKQLNSDLYHVNFRILDIGDIRSVRKLLDKIVEEGIWHEFCCHTMPGELLSKHSKNKKLNKIIQSYRAKLDDEAWAEVSKALR